jgi:hypothetical protein
VIFDIHPEMARLPGMTVEEAERAAKRLTASFARAAAHAAHEGQEAGNDEVVVQLLGSPVVRAALQGVTDGRP